MRQKKVFLILLILILFLSTMILANALDEEEKVAKAFEWLNNEVSDWSNLNIKQHVFSLLALQCNNTAFKEGNLSLYEKSIYSNGKRCFGQGEINSQSQCTLTETALAKIYADEIAQDVEAENIRNWIIGQNKTFTDIDWFLQIDIEQGQSANCSIIYDFNGQGQEESGFKIYGNKTVDIIGSSDCFSDAEYWFKVKKQNEQCYNKDYTVKCWSGSSYFTVSWFYKKPGSEIIYVSGETQSGQPGYGTQEPDTIDTSLLSYCLTSPAVGSGCDYEGTAWASYALAKQGNNEDANVYLPYLITKKEDYVKYFPDTFLYQLMGTSIYGNKIRNEQKPQGYWLIQPIVYGRNYDTAHAVMALGLGEEESDKAKDWILASQTTQGYWDASDPGKNTIRDTAFILWVFWPDICPSTGGDCEAQGGAFTCRDTCLPIEILIDYLDCPYEEICCKTIGAGGDDCVLEGGLCKDSCNINEFELSSVLCPGTERCCKNYLDATCDEAGGEFCGVGLMCSGDEVETLDSTITDLCCLGDCIAAQTCTEAGGVECSPLQGLYCQAGYEVYAIDTDYCCEDNYCQDASTMYCYELDGELCEGSEVCINNGQIPFINTLDGSCCVDGYCGVNDYCANIGEECLFGEECYQNVYTITLDTDECCTTECVGYCSDQEGEYCYDNEDCSGGTFVNSIEGSKCCVGGTCKKGGAFPWWIIIVIVVILGGGAAAYFLYFKKPKKPKQKKPGFPFARPSIRPGMPPMRPGMRPGIRPGAKPIIKRATFPLAPTTKKIPSKTFLERPGVIMPSVPKPEQKMPSAPPSIMRKIQPAGMLSRPVTVNKPKVKRVTRKRTKIKTVKKTKKKRGGSELEETLIKLEKITKKSKKR
jgi:hypothetical protein